MDEATSLNGKSALIVYLRLQLPEMKTPENIFVDLVELDDLSAEGIVRQLLACLEGAKLNKCFLSEMLIGLTCDSAWSCLAARVEWQSDYKLFSQTSSYGTALHIGLAKRLSSCAFVNNLGLMHDALQELSLELQKRDCTIIMAHKAICRQIRVFEAMSQRPGRYSQVTKRGIEENSFQGVPLHTGRASDRNLDQREFFGSLAWNLEKRMLSQGKDQKGYIKLIDDLKVLYPQYWPQDAAALFGEGEVETLCQKLGM